MSTRGKAQVWWFGSAWPWVKGWFNAGCDRWDHAVGWIVVGMVAVAMGKIIRVLLA